MTQPEHERAIAGAAYTAIAGFIGPEPSPPAGPPAVATGGSGGAQESYTGLLLGLDRSRYEVRALSLSAGSAVQRLRALGVPVEVLDETDDEVAVRELVAWLRREEIDLVHAHMFRAEVIGTRAAVAAGTAAIVATVHSSRVRSDEDVRLLASLTSSMDRLIVPSEAIARKVRAEGREGGAVRDRSQRGGPVAVRARRCGRAPCVASSGSRRRPASRRGRSARAGEGPSAPDRGDARDPSGCAGDLAGRRRRGVEADALRAQAAALGSGSRAASSSPGAVTTSPR